MRRRRNITFTLILPVVLKVPLRFVGDEERMKLEEILNMV
jgi:hypothetical protein